MNAYFAGLLDGEGGFYLYKKGTGQRPIIQINMTCEKTVRAVQEHFACGTVRMKKVDNPKWKPQWRWCVYYFDALSVVRAVRPYLLVKAADADKLLAYSPKRKKGNPRD